MRKNISLRTFRTDISSATTYDVDVNALLGVCGASPIRAHYKTDRVVVIDSYPESILLTSNENYIKLSQIQKIIKNIDKNGNIVYEIICGRLKPFETTVKIAQS